MSNKTKKVVVKKENSRLILGKKLSLKPTKEVLATVEVIKNNASKKAVNVSFDVLFNEFKVELLKLGSKSNSNLKTRFRRCLYRNLEAVLLKNSIQSAKFNIKANLKGITIKAKNTIEFKDNGDAITSTVDSNFYTFRVLKKITVIDKLEITKELLAKVNELKK